MLPETADGATSLDGAMPLGSSEIACPHCGASNPTSADRGAILDCRHCNRSFGQPRPPLFSRTVGRTGSGSGFDPMHARSPTDVGLRLTGAVAAVVTLVFYVAVIQPLSGSYFADLFGDRGWVPYGITWLSAWAGVLLVIKMQLLASQRRALDLDLLPESIAMRVTPGNAGEFRAHVGVLAARLMTRPALAGVLGPGASRNLLVERIESALERFRMRGSASDVADQLVSQSQLDANAVESSYTMVRVFIWAIPLLGFIGTVIGISAAVAGFSDSVASAVDLDVMKQSIGSVTTGLGIAFDTTLLALVMSIVIMFPVSSLQKAEEDFLNRVEFYCDERLARRLDDGATPVAGQTAVAGQTPVADRESAANGLEELQGQLTRLAKTIETLDAKLTRSD